MSQQDIAWRHLTRGGRYFRVCSPDWVDPWDTTFSARTGGRWNPPGAFGVLYLNATLQVAAANARRCAAVHGYALADLLARALPELAECAGAEQPILDLVTPAGVAAVGLPVTYPVGVGHAACQPIGRAAFDAGEQGVAYRSAAEAATGGAIAGEELALFDRRIPLVTRGARRRFAEWYPRA